MALPRTLKYFNVFYQGNNFAGQVLEFELPKLGRKMEGYRPGGVSGEIESDVGLEKLECEHTYAGLMREIFNDFGIQKVDGVQLRFAGSYQHEDTGNIDAVEVVVRGRHSEIDPGKAKSGDKTEFKVKSALTYYKLTINGEVVIEIDLLNMIENVNGTDRLADHRTAIGL